MNLDGKAIGSFGAKEAQASIGDFARGVLLSGDDPAAVLDGVAYALPSLLPDTLREHLEQQGTLDKFVRESYEHALQDSTAPFSSKFAYGDIYENPLYEWNYVTRYYIAEQAHAAYHRNPDAKALNHIAYFAVGSGFQLLTYNPEVEATLQRFIDHPFNRVREYENQAALDLLVDGELVLRWFEQDGDVPYFEPQRPWELRGIRHAIDNRREVMSYDFATHRDTGGHHRIDFDFNIENVPADEVTFVKINAHTYELRGRSELFSILPWLRARKEWLENRARINYWLSILLWHVSIDTTNQNVFEAVKARWSKPPKPNSIAVEHSNVQVSPISASPRAGESREDGHQLLLQIAKGLNLPEYFLSDGENANLATATKQQLPALMKFENMQRILIRDLWTPMFRKALQSEVNAGRLPIVVQKHDGNGEPISGEYINTVDAFAVSYPPVVEEDVGALTAALEKQVLNEFISVRQARLKLGVDPDVVERELVDEREMRLNDQAAGRLPIPPPPEEDDDDE